MTILKLPVSNTHSVDVTVRESDPYTETVFVKFDRAYATGVTLSCNEMFLSVDQMTELGEFFLARAAEAKNAQALRKNG